MAMARTLGFTLALVLALAPAARADSYVPIMRDTALAYWAERGVTGCPQGVTVEVATLDGFAIGQAGVGGCWVTIEARLASDAAAGIGTRARGQRLYLRRHWVRTMCQTVYHEVGHALGLDHGYGGVMAQAFYGAEIPADCQWYARALVARASHPRAYGASRRR